MRPVARCRAIVVPPASARAVRFGAAVVALAAFALAVAAAGALLARRA